MAAVQAPAALVGRACRSVAGVILSGSIVDGSLFDKSLIYVTGKGGVGKTTVAAALGHHGGRARAAHDRLRGGRAGPRLARLPAPSRRAPETEVALDETCGRSRSTRGARSRSGSRASSPRDALVRALDRLARLPVLRRGGAGREGADHDRQGVGARPARALGPPIRTYDLVIVDAPAAGHGVAMLRTPQHVRRDRARRPDPPPGAEDPRLLAAPRAHRLRRRALPEEMPVVETLELEQRLRDDGRARARRGRGQRGLSRPLHQPGGRALRARPSATGSSPPPRPPLAAALAEHQRARTQRAHLRRLRREHRARPCSRCRSCSTPELGLEGLRAGWRPAGADLA